MELFDVASMMGFEEYEKEDYGQTLGCTRCWSWMLYCSSSFRSSTARDTIASFALNFVGGDPWYNVTVAKMILNIFQNVRLLCYQK